LPAAARVSPLGISLTPHAHTHTLARTHAHTHAHTNTHTHTHTHTPREVELVAEGRGGHEIEEVARGQVLRISDKIFVRLRGVAGLGSAPLHA
jgi:hypothetical protein